jgi:hypothetical protein
MAFSANNELHEIAFSNGWGSLQLVLGDDDVVRLLSVAIKREGGQVAFAKHHRVNRTYLNMVLRRKRPVGDAVTEALGLPAAISAKAPVASPRRPRPAYLEYREKCRFAATRATISFTQQTSVTSCCGHHGHAYVRFS